MSEINEAYSSVIAGKVRDYLVNDDWHFAFDEEAGIFNFELTVSGAIKRIAYRVLIRPHHYIIYVMSPIGADPDDPAMMSRMAEMLHRANYGLRNGCFEMDYRDGELRFRCCVNCVGMEETLPDAVIESSIYSPMTAFKRYGKAVVDMIFREEISPADAVAACENRTVASPVSTSERTGGGDDTETDEEADGDE